jgi:hypothetical protein
MKDTLTSLNFACHEIEKIYKSWIVQAVLPPRGNFLLEIVKIVVLTDTHTYLNCVVITDCFQQVLPSNIHCTSLHLAEGFTFYMGTEFCLLLFHMHKLIEVGCLCKLSSITLQIAIDFSVLSTRAVMHSLPKWSVSCIS